jgi:hypothetical protein
MEGLEQLVAWPVKYGGLVAAAYGLVAAIASVIWAYRRPRRLAEREAVAVRESLGDAADDLGGRDGEPVVVRGVLAAADDEDLASGNEVCATSRAGSSEPPAKVWLEREGGRILLEGVLEVRAGSDEDRADITNIQRRLCVGDEVVARGIVGERAASTRGGEYRDRAVRYILSPEMPDRQDEAEDEVRIEAILLATAAAPHVASPGPSGLIGTLVAGALLFSAAAYAGGWGAERTCRRGDDPAAVTCHIALMTPFHREAAMRAVDNNYFFQVDDRGDEDFLLRAIAHHLYLGEPCEEIVAQIDREHVRMHELAAERCGYLPALRVAAEIRLRRSEFDRAQALVDQSPVQKVEVPTQHDLRLDMAIRLARKDYRGVGELTSFASTVQRLKSTATDEEKEQHARYMDAMRCLGHGFNVIGGAKDALSPLRKAARKSKAEDFCGLVYAAVQQGDKRYRAARAVDDNAYYRYSNMARGLAGIDDPATIGGRTPALRSFTEIVAGREGMRSGAAWMLARAAAMTHPDRADQVNPRARIVTALDAAEVLALVGQSDEAMAMVARADEALVAYGELEPRYNHDEELAQYGFNISRLRAAIHLRFGRIDEAAAAIRPSFDVDSYRRDHGKELEALVSCSQDRSRRSTVRSATTTPSTVATRANAIGSPNSRPSLPTNRSRSSRAPPSKWCRHCSPADITLEANRRLWSTISVVSPLATARSAAAISSSPRTRSVSNARPNSSAMPSTPPRWTRNAKESSRCCAAPSWRCCCPCSTRCFAERRVLAIGRRPSQRGAGLRHPSIILRAEASPRRSRRVRSTGFAGSPRAPRAQSPRRSRLA